VVRADRSSLTNRSLMGTFIRFAFGSIRSAIFKESTHTAPHTLHFTSKRHSLKVCAAERTRLCRPLRSISASSSADRKSSGPMASSAAGVVSPDRTAARTPALRLTVVCVCVCSVGWG
jgi:hypothetical protein